MTCTFFGHRYTPNEIEPILRSTIIDLIENKGVDKFYVGNQGDFDAMVHKSLKIIKEKYPHINYSIVLAYMPKNKNEDDYTDYSDTVFPDGLERVPPKFAINKRNEWMIKNSDYAITYVRHIVGGAAKFKEMAENKGLFVVNLII